MVRLRRQNERLHIEGAQHKDESESGGFHGKSCRPHLLRLRRARMKERPSRWVVAFILLLSGPPAYAQDACERLASAKISNTTITLAQTVAAGTFNGPPAPKPDGELALFYKSLPAFCRVVAEAKPTSDSDIKLEVWLPVSGWNSKLEGIGVGGFAGSIDHVELATSMKAGYAATKTDTGHTGSSPIDAAWAMGHPEKIIDY